MEKKKQYTASRRVQEAQEAVQEHRKSRPGDFASDDDGRLKDAMDALLSRKEFQYRLDGDALYRRYHAQAVRDGRRSPAATAAPMPRRRGSRPMPGSWRVQRIASRSCMLWPWSSTGCKVRG